MSDDKNLRLDKAIKYLIMEGIVTSQEDVANKMNANKVSITNAIKGNKKYLTDNFIERFCNTFDVINKSWIVTGSGEMIKRSKKINSEDNLIPFYDVDTYGGINGKSADVETAVSIPTSYIKAGEWFGKKITQAIRHYGDSMIEYPSGCILALKRITDIDEIVWGRNYVIETRQNRVTKRLQTCENENYIMAYSSNTETYPDGKQIHEPFRIKKENIKHIFLVIGMISKEESSSTMNAI